MLKLVSGGFRGIPGVLEGISEGISGVSGDFRGFHGRFKVFQWISGGLGGFQEAP